MIKVITVSVTLATVTILSLIQQKQMYKTTVASETQLCKTTSIYQIFTRRHHEPLPVVARQG